MLVEATKRYTDIIFAWGAPTGSTVTEPSLTSVEIIVDNPDDTFATLQLGMDESYSLSVPATSNGTAQLHAPTVWGALRGLETLAQMIEYHPPNAFRNEPHPGEYTLAWAPWQIDDYPRFQHRGIMFDTARHYLKVSTLFRQLDAMAAAKLNTMHIHLTDSTSVPIVSKSFPELAAKGAFGPAMLYSPDDMRQVVEYARHRGIRVVPEWDMPGHSDAWAGGAPPGVMVSCGSIQPLGQFLFDPTSEATYEFLDTFFSDMDEIFPDKIWHLGGDEVGPGCFNQSTAVQAYLCAATRASTSRTWFQCSHAHAPDRSQAWPQRHDVERCLRIHLHEGQSERVCGLQCQLRSIRPRWEQVVREPGAASSERQRLAAD